MKKNCDLKISAVIVAAGKGTRMNMDINKVYVEVYGKPVIARTIEVFEKCSCIDEIILVVGSQELIHCKQNIVDFYGFTKVKTLVCGGRERQNSVYNGILEVSKDCDIVLVHDGARPFLNEENIIDSVDAAYEYGAASVAVPVKDTVKVSDAENFASETLDRSRLWSIQTPQAFRYDIIIQAHERAVKEGFIGTDDAVLVERMGQKMKLVMGNYYNIKITTKEDLSMARAIIEELEF
jgi:2-C-methyl-D-erythritol 4-phosphate cytidylyltransferase